MPRRRLFVLMSVLVCLRVRSGGATLQANFSAIRNGIFLGQSYPSGHIYLRSFNEERKPDSWPKTLTVVPLPDESRRVGASTALATLSSVGKPSAYIPAIEGMDDQHDPCGTGGGPGKNPVQAYLSRDFFDAIVDHCEMNMNVALYRSSPSTNSINVFAYDTTSGVLNIRRITGRRPITTTERQQIAQARKENSSTDCTTTPAYLDSAMLMAQAPIRGGLTIRLSFFDDPGCSGHFATIYLVDILRGTDVLETFQINQSHGAL